MIDYLQKSSTLGAFSINFFFSAFVSLLDLSFPLSFFLLTNSQLPDDIAIDERGSMTIEIRADNKRGTLPTPKGTGLELTWLE